MNPSPTRTLTALFDSHADANAAITRLTAIGIPLTAITLTGGAEHQEKGFWESLGDMFFPEDDREAYAEGLNRGGYLVTVHGLDDDTLFERAADILDESGTVDIDSRTEVWKKEGWKYPTERPVLPRAATLDDTVSVDATGNVDEQVIPVVEERLVVGKRDTTTGRVRVKSYVTETPVSEDVTLRQSHVEVERVPVDRPATEADIAAADKLVEAEETTEEAVIGKEARVVEEVRIKTDQTTHEQTVSDSVRKTKVEQEKLDPKTGRKR